MAESGTLAPWCVSEKWEIGIGLDGKAFARVTGRTARLAKAQSTVVDTEQLRATSRRLVSSRLAAAASATLLELLPQPAAKCPCLSVGLGRSELYRRRGWGIPGRSRCSTQRCDPAGRNPRQGLPALHAHALGRRHPQVCVVLRRSGCLVLRHTAVWLLRGKVQSAQAGWGL
jgi:hypothetical protein